MLDPRVALDAFIAPARGYCDCLLEFRQLSQKKLLLAVIVGK